MQDREPTIRNRALGEGLRQAMKHAGLTGEQAARQLGWSPSLVSRLLSGKRNATESQVLEFLNMCRVTGTERDRLLELYHEKQAPGWWQRHGSRLPEQLILLIGHESKAIAISDFQSTVVPGLLQTGDYARALIKEAGTVPAEEIDGRVAARLGRQSLFSRERPAHFAFYLHEFVLRLPVGGPAVMFEQVDHLLRMSLRPYLTMQVIPAAQGAHAAMAGAFTLMEFADFKPVVYLESEASCLFLNKPDEIEAYQRILGTLAKTALDEEESRELLATLAAELSANCEDPDDPA